MLRVILDTNVIVSAFLNRKSKSAEIIKKWAEGYFDIVFSLAIMEEYSSILVFKNIDSDLIRNLIGQLVKYAKFVTPRNKLDIVKEDSDDNKFFECAVEGKAQYIVSYDKHLLKVKNYKNIKVLTIHKFLKMLDRIHI